MLMRDEEGRMEETSKVKQTTKQGNTAHPRWSLFQKKTNERLSTSYSPSASACSGCTRMYRYTTPVYSHVHLYYICTPVYTYVHVTVPVVC